MCQLVCICACAYCERTLNVLNVVVLCAHRDDVAGGTPAPLSPEPAYEAPVLSPESTYEEPSPDRIPSNPHTGYRYRNALIDVSNKSLSLL